MDKGLTRMRSLLNLIDLVLWLYTIIIIAHIVVSWLVAFNIVNTYNKFVNMIGYFLHRATDPVLRPLRRIIPSIGGIDLTPLVVLLVLWFARSLLWEYGPRLIA